MVDCHILNKENNNFLGELCSKVFRKPYRFIVIVSNKTHTHTEQIDGAVMADVEKAKEAEAEIQAEVKSSPKPSPSKSTGTVILFLLISFYIEAKLI